MAAALSVVSHEPDHRSLMGWLSGFSISAPAASAAMTASSRIKIARSFLMPDLLPRLLPRDTYFAAFYRPIAVGCRNEKSAANPRFLLVFLVVAPTGHDRTCRIQVRDFI